MLRLCVVTTTFTSAPGSARNAVDGVSFEEKGSMNSRTSTAVAPKTVEAHVAHILRKLGLLPAAADHRRVMAVVTYLRHL